MENLDVCIKMLNDPDRLGEWLSVFCTNEFNAYMCQMPPDPQWDPNPHNLCLEQGYQSYFLSCYKFVTDFKSFADAQADCESEGAVLASFPDRYELAFGETVMHYNKIENIWIGLARDDQHQYKWLDDWPLTYTDWYRNEPTEDGCAAMTLSGWNDIDCTVPHAYFCKTTQEIRPSPGPPQYGYCPDDGSIRWNDTCYYFPQNAAATDWDSANYACQSEYGASTLASVHSDEEALFLRTQATLAWGSPYPFWIGLELTEDGTSRFIWYLKFGNLT
ncbi:macrophage mannose receptor 1-like [Amphiura filiformis]|uniref:macrophage mannose receptor 1-like n=1 Tax=Amphiura filiformis TaxID=82378 RepID=UPI003B223639